MTDDLVDCSAATIDDILGLLEPRCTAAELDLVSRAYRFAERAHEGQTRSTGEPYVTHPVAVAGILTCHNLDAPTVAAALLHDTVEDNTEISLEDVRREFGDEVATLVDAVTKLKKREGESLQYRTDREAESLRKMMLGVANDIRVVLIKLADRLHNMRTLDGLAPDKRRRIARETLEIFAPLANRLGIWEWKQQLEDLGFQYAEPEQYTYISKMLEQTAHEREAALQRIIAAVRDALADLGIKDVEITGRTKQIYSIWRKMQRKDRSFDQIMDVRAIRIIIEDGTKDEPPGFGPNGKNGDDAPVDVADIITGLNQAARQERKRGEQPKGAAMLAQQQCYMALGAVHQLWTPMRGEFDDYIARPKDNHYQSLHTAVMADDGKTLEIQIRTRSMHRAAEFGIAAHWIYKERNSLSKDYADYLDSVREAIKALSTADDDAAGFVSTLKTETAPRDTIFCFTPKGRSLEMPKGSTVLDFAYHIHTDIGNHCRGGKVNGVFVPLTYKLNNGDQVEVVTRPNATPSRDWLHDAAYAITATARGKIRQWFRKLDRDQNIAAGRDLIEKELKRLSVNWKLSDVYAFFKVEPGKEDDYLEKVGAGTTSVTGIGSRILEEERRKDRERQSLLGNIVPTILRPRRPSEKRGGWHVVGVYDVRGEPASCCNPLPGDDVIGYVTRGQGIKVHRRDCKNTANAEPERLIEVAYSAPEEAANAYPVQFLVSGVDRPGLLSELTNVFAEQHINLLDFGITKRDQKQGTVDLWFKAEMSRASEVGLLLNRMRLVKNVFDTRRIAGNLRRA